MKERYKLENGFNIKTAAAIALVSACIDNGWTTDKELGNTALKDLKKGEYRIIRAEYDSLTNELEITKG